MKVKICGARTIEDGLMIEEAGADFIGFVFAPSKRQISIEQAAEISRHLTHIKKIGVFVNPTFEELKNTIEQVQLDYIQLHGDEPKELAQCFPNQVIKAFPSNSALSFNEMFSYPAEYILVDSPRKKHYGGSGTPFDWEQLKDKDVDRKKLVLAGGLTPENIKEAILTAQPSIIDVSSGVETNGQKDSEKINLFIKNIRSVHYDKSIYSTR